MANRILGIEIDPIVIGKGDEGSAGELYSLQALEELPKPGRVPEVQVRIEER